MANLSHNWITENLLDFEYKKYVLLAYLQKVDAHFNQHMLYPDLAELIEHYKNLIQLKNNTLLLETNFKKNLKGIDSQNMKLVYENVINDDSLTELKQIIKFTEPLLTQELNKGKQIFDFSEQHILSSHIGVLPIYKQEGYFVLYPFQSNEASVYTYTLSKVNVLQQEVYGLHTNYLLKYTVSLSKPIDYIKQEIISSNPDFPNPSVFLFTAKAKLPNTETFLPIAKRLLYKKVINS